MDPNTESQQADPEAGAPEAITTDAGASDAGTGVEPEAGSQPETDGGSASSAEAVDDTRTPAEIMRDEFLKTYGKQEEPEEAPKPEEPKEPKPEATERTESAPEGRVRLTDEEVKALPPRAQARLGQLSAELREARQAAAEIDDYRDYHDRYAKLSGFMEQNRLSGEDVATTLRLAAQFTAGQFQPFLDAVMPMVQTAQQALGLAVAPDLQAQIDSGEISEEAAKRLTRSEQQARLAEAAAARERQAREARETAETEADQQRKAFDTMVTAVRNLEATLMTEDAQFALKAPAIRAEFQEILKRDGMPRDAAHAQQIIRLLHKAAVAPAQTTPPKETRPQPAASTASGPRRAPQNLFEALSHDPVMTGQG